MSRVLSKVAAVLFWGCATAEFRRVTTLLTTTSLESPTSIEWKRLSLRINLRFALRWER
jgi:hypothetical protein